MAKIHITLVGGQPAPVYHGIVAIQPDKIVFIYSQESIEVLNSIKKEIDIPVEEIPPLHPTDPIQIYRVAEQLAKKYENDEVTVNISSGLKSWSHWFGIVFDRKPNAAIVYMDQNNVLWNYRTMQPRSDFEFDMHALFRLYGNSLERNYQKYSDYTQEDKDCIEKIEKARSFNNQDFNLLTLDNQQQLKINIQKSGRFSLNGESQSYLEWDRKDNNQAPIVRLKLYNRVGKSQEWNLCSPNILKLVFKAGWFEYKVATLLESWEHSKEICLNCRFPFKRNVDKNETDIIVNTGTKLLFVECKTQITHTTDIDKFRSVIKGYGGTGSKGLFVTEAKMKDIAKKKCEENGILSFSLKDDHWGLSEEKALQLLLDSELYNINTK